MAGGVAGWASLTLPDGTSGPSGALIDPASADNSDNAVKAVVLGAARSVGVYHARCRGQYEWPI